MRCRLFFASLLALSLSVNAYLLLRRETVAKPEARIPKLRAPATTTAAPRFTPSIDPIGLADRPGYARLDRVTLEHRLVTAEARVESLLPPDDRFRQATTPDPDAERAIVGYLDEVFKVSAGADRPYKVTCRGGVCKLEAYAEPEWVARLQDLPGRIRLGAMMFSARQTYIAMLPREVIAERIPDELRERFAFSETAHACIDASPDRGDLTFNVAFDQRVRGFTISLGGSLAPRAVATCLYNVLVEIARGLDVPRDATTIALTTITLQLPVDERDP